MNIKQTQTIVRQVIDCIVEIVVRQSEKRKLPLTSLIVTGSYASWLRDPGGYHHPGWESIPDVNLYALTSGGEQDLIGMESLLGEAASQAARNVEPANLILDLHPFALTAGEVDLSKTNIQLTMRALDLLHPQRYPDYSWFGWISNHTALYPEGKYPFGNMTAPAPKRDTRWLRHMYLALCSYGNILHMLALSASRYTGDYVFDETFRYLKEITKDGFALGVALDAEESSQLVRLIAEWRYRAVDFYKSHYGAGAASIVEKLVAIENDYFRLRSQEKAGDLLKATVQLREIVFDKGFFKRLQELSRQGTAIFSEAPLWY